MASHWGPLLSWLLTPAVMAGWAPLLTAKIISAAFGFIGAAGVAVLTRRHASGRAPLLAFGAMLMLLLTMLHWPVGPDLLLMALMAWYFVLAARWLEGGGAGTALAAGLVGGVAFLAKHYALPFVSTHLVLTFLLRRRQAGRWDIRPLLAGLTGLAAVALPWVAVISAHDGRVTIGPAAYGRAFGPVAAKGHDDLPLFQLARPREGRLTGWENPSEIPHPLRVWSPLDGREGLRLQARNASALARKTVKTVWDADAFKILLAGGLLALPLGLFGWLKRCPQGTLLFWTAGSALVYAAGYALVHVERRFLWPVLGLLVILPIGIARGVLDRPGVARALGRSQPVVTWTLATVLLASIAISVVTELSAWTGPKGFGAEYKWLKDASQSLAVKQPLATNEWHQGLFAAYWVNLPFLGRFTGRSADAVADELTPYGRTDVLLWEDRHLADELARDPRFRRIGQSTSATGRTLDALAFDPMARMSEESP